MPVDDLIRALLATGDMNEDTATELNRMLAESKAGALDPDDAEYVRALHARLDPAAASPADGDDGAPDQPPVERLDGLSIAEWRDRALRAETALAEVRDQLASD